jgi:DNA-binding HxlR family transcriptional regulator
VARPVMELLDLLGRRWTLRVVWELRGDTGLTFRELQAASGDLSSSVLTDRLRELTQAGLVGRATSGYVLTGRGRELLELLLPLDAWATKWARSRP